MLINGCAAAAQECCRDAHAEREDKAHGGAGDAWHLLDLWLSSSALYTERAAKCYGAASALVRHRSQEYTCVYRHNNRNTLPHHNYRITIN